MKKKPQIKERTDSATLKRMLFVAVILGGVMYAVVVARLFQLQIVDYDVYAAKANNQQTKDKLIPAARGTIYDVNMKPMAISASTEIVSIEARKIKDKQQAELISQNLAEILGLEYEDVLAKALKDRAYEIVKKGVEKEVADEVRRFLKANPKINSVFLSPDSKRYYPFGSFASQVLGFVGSEQQGLEGIETLYEKYLVGAPGRVVTAVNGEGQEMPFEFETYVDAVDGYDVVLTIDEVIQHYVEQGIRVAYEDNKVEQYVGAIVMDIKTGGILAMATTPDYDPNQPFTLNSKAQSIVDIIENPEEKKTAFNKELTQQWRNRMVSDTYEPGSTFKTLTLAMALEEKTISKNITFNCTGSTMVPGWGKPIRCWKRTGHGTQTLAQAVENSCNPAFIAIGRSVGVTDFSKYFRAFGLTEKTGIDAMGESGSIYHKENKMTEVDLATSSFGQTFQITPIQLITAISAVANDGYLMKPHIVKQVLDKDGNVVQSYDSEPIRQVVSSQTSKDVLGMLEGVVSNGTGKNAYVPGYRVGGKTGTTEKKVRMAQTGRDDLRITSFMAVAPVDDPQIAVLVLLDEPTVLPIGGGTSAAPVVRKILEDTLPYLGVTPIYTEAELAIKDQVVPDVSTLTEAAAAAELKKLGFGYRKVGTGDVVTDQLPAPNSIVPPIAEVILYMGEAKPEKEVTVPDLTGMKFEKARTTLKNIEIYMSSGGVVAGERLVVRKQSIPPGTKVPVGTVVTVELSDPSASDHNDYSQVE